MNSGETNSTNLSSPSLDLQDFSEKSAHIAKAKIGDIIPRMLRKQPDAQAELEGVSPDTVGKLIDVFFESVPETVRQYQLIKPSQLAESAAEFLHRMPDSKAREVAMEAIGETLQASNRTRYLYRDTDGTRRAERVKLACQAGLIKYAKSTGKFIAEHADKNPAAAEEAMRFCTMAPEIIVNGAFVKEEHLALALAEFTLQRNQEDPDHKATHEVAMRAVANRLNIQSETLKLYNADEKMRVAKKVEQAYMSASERMIEGISNPIFGKSHAVNNLGPVAALMCAEIADAIRASDDPSPDMPKMLAEALLHHENQHLAEEKAEALAHAKDGTAPLRVLKNGEAGIIHDVGMKFEILSDSLGGSLGITRVLQKNLAALRAEGAVRAAEALKPLSAETATTNAPVLTEFHEQGAAAAVQI